MPLEALGEFALMREHLEAALHYSRGMAARAGTDNDLYALMVDAAVEQRDLEGIEKYAPLTEASAGDIQHRLHMGIAERAFGVGHTLKGEYAEAEKRFRRALELFATYPANWQMGRTQFEMGEMARAQGEKVRAKEHYTQALHFFEELGARPYMERVRAAMQQL